MTTETHLAEFVGRHIGPRDHDIEHMLDTLGYDSLEALIDAAVPPAIRTSAPLALPAADSEQAVIAELRDLAARNKVVTSMIGLGYYGTQTPPVVLRNIMENPAWYTAYTPYQPEISQGRLEALLNFQTVVTDLTGLDIAGASMLDEGTAAAEAMALMRRTSKVADDAVLLVDEHVLPQTLGVVQARADSVGWTVHVADVSGITDEESLRTVAGDRDVFGVLLQYPGADGQVRDFAALVKAAHAAGALVSVAADLLALTLLTAPGTWGADVAVGTTQRFGVSVGFGGPHAGYLAVRKGLERTMPGRLVGVSRDAAGDQAYRLALQTREQHIRREKATSNICTAQVLLAVMASMYAVWHGPEGLRRIALETHAKAVTLAQALTDGGLELAGENWFDTLTVRVPGRAGAVLAAALEEGINLWQVDADTVLLSVDELITLADLQAVARAFGVTPPEHLAPAQAPQWGGLARGEDEPYLTHPVFGTYRSETAMLRYIRSLSDKDYALDRGMIPLGSCTMKLNAT
ncbi:MAG: aminomethyl-transferring glycine dehydrogenase subunit GcvPA, partial [Ornithinimicrobium sp.]|uniref:aminomethyl-transferring glycine dehydrogenase subunit GcvPA n=1 Tax=Ornithinimicrobium sp. TaxID=1977084 RepID=UPI0026E0B6C3